MKTPKFIKNLKPSKIVTDTIESIGGQATSIIDETTYSEEESAANTNTRHAADMASDSLASKSVRPFAFYAFFTLFLLIIFKKVQIEPWAQDMIKTSFYMVLGWYFGERGIIKILREVKKKTK